MNNEYSSLENYHDSSRENAAAYYYRDSHPTRDYRQCSQSLPRRPRHDDPRYVGAQEITSVHQQRPADSAVHSSQARRYDDYNTGSLKRTSFEIKLQQRPDGNAKKLSGDADRDHRLKEWEKKRTDRLSDEIKVHNIRAPESAFTKEKTKCTDEVIWVKREDFDETRNTLERKRRSFHERGDRYSVEEEYEKKQRELADLAVKEDDLERVQQAEEIERQRREEKAREMEKKRKEELEKKKKEEEIERKRQEQEQEKKREEELARKRKEAEIERKRREEETQRRQQEELERKLREVELERIRMAEEAEIKRREEQMEKKQKEEELEKKRAAETEKKRKVEEEKEKKRKEEEQHEKKWKEEMERKRLEEEKRRKAELEQKRREEEKRKLELEAEKRRKEEQQLRKQKEEEAENRKKELEKQMELDKKMKEEEENRQKELLAKQHQEKLDLKFAKEEYEQELTANCLIEEERELEKLSNDKQLSPEVDVIPSKINECEKPKVVEEKEEEITNKDIDLTDIEKTKKRIAELKKERDEIKRKQAFRMQMLLKGEDPDQFPPEVESSESDFEELPPVRPLLQANVSITIEPPSSPHRTEETFNESESTETIETSMNDIDTEKQTVGIAALDALVSSGPQQNTTSDKKPYDDDEDKDYDSVEECDKDSLEGNDEQQGGYHSSEEVFYDTTVISAQHKIDEVSFNFFW